MTTGRINQIAVVIFLRFALHPNAADITKRLFLGCRAGRQNRNRGPLRRTPGGTRRRVVCEQTFALPGNGVLRWTRALPRPRVGSARHLPRRFATASPTTLPIPNRAPVNVPPSNSCWVARHNRSHAQPCWHLFAGWGGRVFSRGKDSKQSPARAPSPPERE